MKKITLLKAITYFMGSIAFVPSFSIAAADQNQQAQASQSKCRLSFDMTCSCLTLPQEIRDSLINVYDVESNLLFSIPLDGEVAIRYPISTDSISASGSDIGDFDGSKLEGATYLLSNGVPCVIADRSPFTSQTRGIRLQIIPFIEQGEQTFRIIKYHSDRNQRSNKALSLKTEDNPLYHLDLLNESRIKYGNPRDCEGSSGYIVNEELDDEIADGVYLMLCDYLVNLNKRLKAQGSSLNTEDSQVRKIIIRIFKEAGILNERNGEKYFKMLDEGE